MIIQNNYMPSLTRMSDAEAAEYWSDLQSWLSDSLPVLQASSEWGENEVALFDRGLVLLSAFTRARDFIPSAYRWSTTEKRLSSFLYYVEQIHSHLAQRNLVQKETVRIGFAPKFTDRYQLKRNPRQSFKRAVSDEKTLLAQASNTCISEDEAKDNRRPQHFDEYKHLLPANLREEGENIKKLYLEFADYRHKLEVIADNPKGTKQDRGFYARKVCAIEDKIKNFWHRVDIAYAQQTGKEISTDYINVIKEETAKVNAVPRERLDGEHTKIEIDMLPEGEDKERFKKQRIDRDKKLLRKADRKVTEGYAKTLLAAATELHDWGYFITDTQQAVCEKYGVSLDPSWLEPSKEEKKALRAQRRKENNLASYHRCKQRKDALANEMKASEEQAGTAYDSEGISIFNPESLE